MTIKTILLDATPLGLLCGQVRKPNVAACRQWCNALKAAGHTIIIPEITDYEVRRELTRAHRVTSVDRLDRLQNEFFYLPLHTDAMLMAADLWARARQSGHQTASGDALDGDVILAAQALYLGLPNTVIATANVAHLVPLAPAELWSNITP